VGNRDSRVPAGRLDVRAVAQSESARIAAERKVIEAHAFLCETSVHSFLRSRAATFKGRAKPPFPFARGPGSKVRVPSTTWNVAWVSFCSGVSTWFRAPIGRIFKSSRSFPAEVLCTRPLPQTSAFHLTGQQATGNRLRQQLVDSVTGESVRLGTPSTTLQIFRGQNCLMKCCT
jgi:hypothetical protein